MVLKKPFDEEGRLRMPTTNRHWNYQTDWNHQTHPIHLQSSFSPFTPAKFLKISIDIHNNLLCLRSQSLSSWHVHKHERKRGLFA